MANEVNAGAADVVDAWFTAWALADESERERVLATIATETIQYSDRYSVIDGRSELEQHIGGAIRFMPGVRMQRKGAVRHCQGTLLVDWSAVRGDDRQEFASGTSVFVLEPGGRIASATGFWN